jgi:hypothetical protein
LILQQTATATTTSCATLKAKQNAVMCLSGLVSLRHIYLDTQFLVYTKVFMFLVNGMSFVYVSDVPDIQHGATIDIYGLNYSQRRPTKEIIHHSEHFLIPITIDK